VVCDLSNIAMTFSDFEKSFQVPDTCHENTAYIVHKTTYSDRLN